jgi:hypothetical protein
MSLVRDHALLMLVHATLLAAFLALLWREEPRAVRRFFVTTWLALVGGGLALAWLLFRPAS